MPPHASAATRESQARAIGGPLLIVLVGVLAFSGGLGGEFVFDDHATIGGVAVQQGAPWSFWLSHSRGVSLGSFRLQQLLAPSITAYHVVNLIIHLLNGLLLYEIVRRTLLAPRWIETFRPHSAPLALVAALAWTVHPLTTQAVLYVTQRMELLATFAYLASLYGLIRALAGDRRGWWLTLIAVGLGLRCKEIVVTAPLVLVGFDRAVWSESWREVFSRRWWYLTLCLVTLLGLWPMLTPLQEKLLPQLVSTQGEQLQQAVDDEATEWVLKDVSPREYVQSQPGVIVHYLRLACLPSRLCFDYDWPVARDWGAIAAPGVIVVGLLIAVAWLCWQQPPWGWLGATFFLVLAPTSSIVPIRDLCVEHRMYLPLATLIVGLVLTVYLQVCRNHAARSAFAARWIVVPIVLLSCLTFLRSRDYATAASLWGDTVRKAPHNARAHYNYARAITDLPQPTFAQLSDAKQHLQWVIEHQPQAARAHNSLGLLLLKLGDPAGAREHFGHAARLRPDFVVTHNNLGILLARDGKLVEAVAAYERAIALNPEYAEAHNNLAIALTKLGRPDEAIRHFTAALRIKPDYAAARKNLELLQNEQRRQP